MTARIVRALWIFGSLLFMAGAACAQVVPDAISYQGKLADTSGQPVADGSYDVQFQMYTVSSGGSSFWTSDTMTVQTVGGVFSTVMQRLTPSTLSGRTDVWIETLVAPHGGSLVALAPRVKLAAVPFAIRAADVALPFAGTVSSGSTAVSATNTGTGSAGSFQINNGASSSNALTAITSGTGSAIRAQGATAATLFGNVGIGISNPAYPLDVVGIIRSLTGGFKFPDGSTQTAAGVTGSGTDNYLVRWNGTGAVQASAIYQADSGTIGIGTTSPDPGSKLQIDTSGGVGRALIGIATTGFWGGQAVGNSFAGLGDPNNPILKIQSNHGNPSENDKILQVGRGNSPILTVQGDGVVKVENGGAISVSSQDDRPDVRLMPGSGVETANYIIFKSGSNYHAKEGETGSIVKSSQDVVEVFNEVFARLLANKQDGRADGASVVIRGYITLNSPLVMPAISNFVFDASAAIFEYTPTDSTNAITVDSAINCNFHFGMVITNASGSAILIKPTTATWYGPGGAAIVFADNEVRWNTIWKNNHPLNPMRQGYGLMLDATASGGGGFLNNIFAGRDIERFNYGLYIPNPFTNLAVSGNRFEFRGELCNVLAQIGDSHATSIHDNKFHLMPLWTPSSYTSDNGARIYGDGNIFEVLAPSFAVMPTNGVFVIGSDAQYNLFFLSNNAYARGWTDNSGNQTNKMKAAALADW